MCLAFFSCGSSEVCGWFLPPPSFCLLVALPPFLFHVVCWSRFHAVCVFCVFCTSPLPPGFCDRAALCGAVLPCCLCSAFSRGLAFRCYGFLSVLTVLTGWGLTGRLLPLPSSVAKLCVRVGRLCLRSCVRTLAGPRELKAAAGLPSL